MSLPQAKDVFGKSEGIVLHQSVAGLHAIQAELHQTVDQGLQIAVIVKSRLGFIDKFCQGHSRLVKNIDAMNDHIETVRARAKEYKINLKEKANEID